MKTTAFCCIVLLLILTSCKEKGTTSTTEKPSGKALFADLQCAACHKENQKIIGPSLKEMAKIYKAEQASIAQFLNFESKPIIDPSQYEIMKINIEETKKRTPQEREALEAYIMGFE